MGGLVAAGDGDGSEWMLAEGLIATEDFDEGAFAGRVDDEVGLLMGAGQGSEDGAEAGGEV